MTKKRSFLLATLVLVFTLALTCGLAACGSKKEKHTITWDYDSNAVTVTADGYDELPTELEEEAELSLTVTALTGYELGSVSGAKKQENGTYLLTMGTKDVTVKITASKILNGITVEVLNKTAHYYEDDTVGADDIKVTAKYELGDEVLKASDYSISYPVYKTNHNDETGEDEVTVTYDSVFSDGSTSYIVSFGGYEKEIELDYTVTTSVVFKTAKLELNDKEDGVVLVMTGIYVANGDAETYVEGFINDCTERKTWSSMSWDQKITVDEEKDEDGNTPFTLYLTIEEMRAGYHYYFHVRGGADGQNLTCENVEETAKAGDDNNDLTFEKIEGKEPIVIDGIEYYLGNCEDWNPTTLMIIVNDPVASVLNLTNAYLEQADSKVYLVLDATVKNYDLDEITITFGDGEDLIELDKYEQVEGSYKLYFDITAREKNELWCHLYIDGETFDGDLGNVCYGKDGEELTTADGKNYKFERHEGTWWVLKLYVTTV